MLKKIVTIKNVGRFRNSAAAGVPEFAKHSFIFGANGHGKTTICAILRSVKTGEASHVVGRKTLGVADSVGIDILTNSGLVKFRGAAWDSAKPEIAIFDSSFVSDNVHSGDIVDSDQKRNLYRVIIGEVGVALAVKEKALAEESRTKTTEITHSAAALQPHMVGMKADEFVALRQIDEIDQKIAAQESTLTAIREADSIKKQKELTKVIIPDLPAYFAGLMAKTIDDIAKDAEQQVRTHFEAHGMTTKDGANWAVQQIDHTADSCPFCGQDTKGLSLIAAYKSVFSDQYKVLRRDIKVMKDGIDQAMGETAIAKLETFTVTHKATLEFWTKYCLLSQTDLQLPADLAQAITGMHSAATVLIERKALAPLEAIATDQSFLHAQAAYEAIKDKVINFNQAVETANSLLVAQKAAAGTADLAVATTEMNRLKTNKARFDAAVIPLCANYQALVTAQIELETQKKAIRDQLDQHTKTVVTPYQKRINELLENFNAEFSIAETKHSYVGGSATSTYRLVINRTPIDIGGGNTPIDTPSFKNTLSAGDRSTLALAFFFAHLERDPGLTQKVVIFDDPFNSQDAFRRRQTILEIVKLGKQCAQIIVLSHDPTFLKQIWDKCLPVERVALALADHGQQGTKIMAHDLERACQGRTATETDDLQAFMTLGTGHHIDIIRKMRTVLETYMKTTYPALFSDTDWLGDIVGKIRAGGATYPAVCLYDELDAINDYTKPYHHGEKITDRTPDTIDSSELRGFTKRTLRIVNAI
ncbi:MAG: AAA family ATPase [Alphaproteobacteria bacterium]